MWGLISTTLNILWSDKLENLVIHFDTEHTFEKTIISTTKPVEILAIVVNILFRNV